jgi:hypothetical protein
VRFPSLLYVKNNMFIQLWLDPNVKWPLILPITEKRTFQKHLVIDMCLITLAINNVQWYLG